MSVKIREVDGTDAADILAELHGVCFDGEAPQADYDVGYWWMAYHDREPIAFAGITPSQLGFNCGYLKRCGILPDYRGQGLQKRLIRVREAKAKRLGWSRIVTDCTNNPASANNLFRAGYKLFTPKHYWFRESTLYWTKNL